MHRKDKCKHIRVLESQSLLATMLDWTAELRTAALEIYFAQCVSNRVVQHGVVTNL